MSCVVGLPNNSYKPITNTAWVPARLCKLQKGCTRLATASDKVYQLLAHGRWFSPASSTIKTGRHDIESINHSFLIMVRVEVCRYLFRRWRSNYHHGCDPITRFNSDTCLCLSQARTWISSAICRKVCLV
jgi:hypothetical protein